MIHQFVQKSRSDKRRVKFRTPSFAATFDIVADFFLSNIDFVLFFFFLSIFRYGAQSLIVSRFLHHIVALYQDPTAPVRDAAAGTLVEIYRHIGDRVRVDLQKKHNIPPAK